MSRPILAALLLLSWPAVAFAQDATEAGQQDPQAAYSKLVKDYQEAAVAHRKRAIAEAEKAKAAGKRVPMIRMTPDVGPFVERAQALALQYAGEDTAVPFHGFVLQYGGSDRAAVKKTVLTLTMDHAEGKAISAVLDARMLSGAMRAAKTEVMELLAEVIEYNEVADCKAAALIVRGGTILASARTDAQRAAAQKELEQAEALATNADLRAKADSALFEIRHLQIGCEAPDIAANDIDGVEFKLSDYRGKVVLLDFWGFW